ncbi:MAG: M56 family metallopeptidase [Niastella sp.]|uniref:M56 family metallopeptidase n=1 Tax=Niastella sp. TaxID=1869183 RepID=UPI003899A70F
MLQYLLKLTISLSIVYLFYQLFLRRLTFYNWNRWYLLIYSMVCFVIPFINVFTIIVGRPALRELAFVNYIPAITQITPGNTTASVGINWWLVTAVVFLTGILIMAARLGMQYYSLYKMRSKAVLLYDNKVKLYHIDAPVMPFSFGRGIYVNQHQHSEHELKEIIRHEFIHVKQRHSLDIIWSELLCMLNWYNPFAWLLRHDIRQNLEFLADQQVLQTGLDRKQYQYLLLKVIGVNSFSIANNFNFSSLKKRIAMMNKAQSARVHLIRFLFLLPLLVVVLLAFRNTTQIHRQSLRALVTDTIPTAEKMPPGWKDMESIDVNNTKVTVRLKNKKVETYDLSNIKEREEFEKKYGPLPTPPPPPPAPTVKSDIEIKEAPEAPENPEALKHLENVLAPIAPEDPQKLTLAPIAPEVTAVEAVPPPPPPKEPQVLILTPVPPPPPVPVQDCYNQKGFCVNVVDNHGEATVIVKDKDNKIMLAVSLTDWNKDKQQYEEKYGEVPTRQIMLLPKTVMGYKSNHVTIKQATVVKDDEVVAIGKPIEKVVVKNSLKMNEGQYRKVVVTPSNGYMLIAKGGAAPVKLPTQAKIAAEVKVLAEAKVAAETKVATEAKVATSARVATAARAKAEAESREGAEPKPAAPSKEQ